MSLFCNVCTLAACLNIRPCQRAVHRWQMNTLTHTHTAIVCFTPFVSLGRHFGPHKGYKQILDKKDVHVHRTQILWKVQTGDSFSVFFPVGNVYNSYVTQFLLSLLVKFSGEAMFSAAGSRGRSQSIWSRFLKRSSEVPSRSSSAHSQVSCRSVVSTCSCLIIASMDLISSNFPLRTACLFSYGITLFV